MDEDQNQNELVIGSSLQESSSSDLNQSLTTNQNPGAQPSNENDLNQENGLLFALFHFYKTQTDFESIFH